MAVIYPKKQSRVLTCEGVNVSANSYGAEFEWVEDIAGGSIEVEISKEDGETLAVFSCYPALWFSDIDDSFAYHCGDFEMVCFDPEFEWKEFTLTNPPERLKEICDILNISISGLFDLMDESACECIENLENDIRELRKMDQEENENN